MDSSGSNVQQQMSPCSKISEQQERKAYSKTGVTTMMAGAGGGGCSAEHSGDGKATAGPANLEKHLAMRPSVTN